MPDTMNENDHSAEKTEKKFPSVYFAASLMNHIVDLVGAAFFLILGCFILSNGTPLAGVLCFAVTVVFIGDFLDLVIVGSEHVYRTHFFLLSSAIVRDKITICSTSKEKNGDQIYLYGAGSHMTMLRSKRLWKKLMEVIGVPEDVQEKLDTCPGNLYEKKITPELSVRSQRVMIDYLLHSANYVSVEIRRTLTPEAQEETHVSGERPSTQKEEKPGAFDQWAAAKGGKAGRAVRVVRAFVVVPLLVILGFMALLYMWYNSKAQDIRIRSFDDASELVIRGVAHNLDRATFYEVEDHGYGLLLMDSEKKRLYSKFIENNSSYLYSVDTDNTRLKGETGTYVFFQNYRYFTIEMVSGEDQGDGTFLCREMARYGTLPIMAVNSQDEAVALLPIRANAETPIRVEPTKYTWMDTYGMSSYKDLVEFYQRIESQHYTLKEDEQVILVAVYVNHKWYPDALEVRVSDQGFEVRVDDSILKK